MSRSEIKLKDGLGDRLDNTAFQYQMFNAVPRNWSVNAPKAERLPKKSNRAYFNFNYPRQHNPVNRDAFTTTCCNQPTTRVIHTPVSDHPSLEMNLPWMMAGARARGTPKTTDVLFEYRTENDAATKPARRYRTLRR